MEVLIIRDHFFDELKEFFDHRLIDLEAPYLQSHPLLD